MAGWYNKVSDNLSNIIDCIDYYEGELAEAKKECYIKGNVERNSAALPGVTEHRFNQSLANQFSLLRNQYLGIMKGLDTKQWQIGHIVKLRTAGMEDISL